MPNMADCLVAGAVIRGGVVISLSLCGTLMHLLGNARFITTEPVVMELGSRKTLNQKLLEENHRLK